MQIDGSNLHLHAIRRSKWTSAIWTTAHLPFIMSYVLGSAGMARLVLAVDTPDSHLESLTELSQERAELEIPMGIRWFYCVGFGIALIFMGFIAISHEHKEIETLRLKKRWRLCGRFLVAVVIICLPLAEDRLDSLELVGIVTVLVVFCLGLELWASSCCKERLMERSKPCKYTGHCPKKELQRLLKKGSQVDFEMLADKKNEGLMHAAPS